MIGFVGVCRSYGKTRHLLYLETLTVGALIPWLPCRPTLRAEIQQDVLTSVYKFVHVWSFGS